MTLQDPETGVVEVALPGGGPVGFVTMTLMDEDVQVFVGNRGSHMVLKRWAPPQGTLGAAILQVALAASEGV